jgi:DNA polymerase delta subunit 1
VNKTVVEKIDILGFRNLEKDKYIRLCFNTEAAARSCRYIFNKPLRITNLSQNITFKTYETNLDPIVRFTHLRNIRTAGWIKVKRGEYHIDEEEEVSSAQIQATVNWKQVHPYMECETSEPVMKECEDIAPFRMLSWDIECQSSRGFPEFPDADLKGDFISQIGCCMWIFGGEKVKFILSSVKSSELEEGILINCKDERTLLKTFCDLIHSLDPDILTGYNTWGFDDKFFWKRLSINGLLNYANKLSRIEGIEPKLSEKNLISGAYGSNEFLILECPGRETLDMLTSIRREHKLESYKLGRVGTHFKQGTKVSMIDQLGESAWKELGFTEKQIDATLNNHEDGKINEYDTLFRVTASNDPEKIKIVCDYCLQDAALVINLMEKLCVIPNNIEMAKSTRVPFGWLLLKGQQCKVFSQIVYEARLRDFVVPVIDHDDKPTEKFKGATVLTALRGAYYSPVAGLDFKSLYPSIMIAYQMCFSTFVIDPKYMGIEGVEYETVSWHEEGHTDDNTKEWIEAKDYSFTFVQNRNGILPDILDRLWKDRNATKREMKGTFKKCKELCGEHCKGCKHGFRAQVLNGKQLAIKVTMNSVYGFTGAGKGMLPCRPIAASVTFLDTKRLR